MKKLLIIVLCLLAITGCSLNKSIECRDEGDRTAYEYSDNNSKPVSLSSNSYDYDGIVIQTSEEKYVYTGYIGFETTEYEEFISEFNGILEQYNGITQTYEETSSSGKGGRRMFFTVRVPSENFDKFINDLRSSKGSVVRISTESDNITKQYNSNAIRIEALEAQHKRLMELMENADDLSQIILLEQRLSELEIELTELFNYKNSMDADVAYSTINVQIDEVVTYTETNSFWQRIKNAVSGSVIRFVEGIQGFVIDVIYFLPTLAVIVVLYFVLRKPVRNLFNRLVSRKKEPKPVEEPETV